MQSAKRLQIGVFFDVYSGCRERLAWLDLLPLNDFHKGSMRLETCSMRIPPTTAVDVSIFTVRVGRDNNELLSCHVSPVERISSKAIPAHTKVSGAYVVLEIARDAGISVYEGEMRKLAFRLIEQRMTYGERTGMISAVLSAGTTVVVLVQGTTPDSQVSKFITAFGAGVQHVAFAVTDLDEAIEQVSLAGGLADTCIIADEGIRQVFLRRDAGSGVRVELIERKGGEFSDKSVQQLFSEFEKHDLY